MQTCHKLNLDGICLHCTNSTVLREKKKAAQRCLCKSALGSFTTLWEQNVNEIASEVANHVWQVFFLRLLCPCSRTLAWRLALLPFFTAARPHFGLFFVIFKEGSASSVTLPIVFFFFHSERWFPLLLPFACGCSQNMCMSSDVIVTKDNSLRRQEINAGKGGWWLPEQMNKKNWSPRQKRGGEGKGDPAAWGLLHGKKHARPTCTRFTGTQNQKISSLFFMNLSLALSLVCPILIH